MSTLGKEIKKARIDLDLKQKELQERTGLSQKHLSQIENDAVDPRVSVLKKIAQALHVSTDSLLGLNVPGQTARKSSNACPKRMKGPSKGSA